MKHLGLGAAQLFILGAILLGVAGSGSDRLFAAEPEHPSHFSAYLGLLPGLIDSDGSGPFIDLVKAIAALDDGVEVSVMVYPMSRATRSVVVVATAVSDPVRYRSLQAGQRCRAEPV